MDLKGVLHEKKDEKKSDDPSVRTHKKPMQLRDIESRSASNKHQNINTEEDIKNILKKEKENIYKKKWNKLDLGLKVNRIRLFIEQYEDESKKKELSKLLIPACKSGKLNKNTDIIYDSENCIITNIKILKETDGHFSLNITEVKKKQSSGRSKSNIERLLK